MDTRTNADRLDAGLPRGERPDGGRLDSDHSNSERGPLAGLALLAVLAVAFGSAVAVTGVDRLGGFAARLDVGIPVLFVIAGYLLYLPFARALSGATALPGVRRYARRSLLAIYPAYWVVLFVAAFVYERAAPITAVDLAKYLTLTHIYSADTLVGPIPVSWALATGVSFCVFVPLFAAVQRRLPASSEAQRVRYQWLGLAAMVVVALAFRTWLVSLDVTTTGPGAAVSQLTVLGRRAWLLNHLDTFAAGMAIALARVTWERRTVDASGSVGATGTGRWTARSPSQWRWWSIGGALVALVAFVLVVTALGLSPQSMLFSGPREFGRHLLYLLVGAGLVAAVVAGTLGRWWGIRALGSSAMRSAGRLAYGIRDTYVADPAFADVPVEALLSEAFAQRLRERISLQRAMPVEMVLPRVGQSDTVYLSVVDGAGNVCSLINSLFHHFGVGKVCPETGVAFQNRGAGFRVQPGHPNSVRPRKRPLHTIIPAMALRGGRPVLSFGVMGGAYQPTGVVHTLQNVIDFGMDVQEALDAPRGEARDRVADLRDVGARGGGRRCRGGLR